MAAPELEVAPLVIDAPPAATAVATAPTPSQLAAAPPPDPLRKAREEVEVAEQRLRGWEKGVGATAKAKERFDLTVQPVISGEDAAIELAGVTAEMSVEELMARIQAERADVTPDRQRLFIAKGGQEPLEDETLPIGVYAVLPGTTLHLAMRDAEEAAARRARRAEVRAEKAAAQAAKEAAAAARKAVWLGRRAAVGRAGKSLAKSLAKFGAPVALLLLIIYLAAGCKEDTCNGGGVCSGFVAQCTCFGNFVGEYCEHDCGCSGGGEQTDIEAIRAAAVSHDFVPPGVMTFDGDEVPAQVRIAGGGSRGVLELNLDGGGWDAVCKLPILSWRARFYNLKRIHISGDDDFNDDAATAFCRELGYEQGTLYGATHGDDSFAADDIECPSGATGISQCSSGRDPYEDNCSDGETVGIECSGSFAPPVCAAGSCSCEGTFAGEFCQWDCGCSGHGNQTDMAAIRGRNAAVVASATARMPFTGAERDVEMRIAGGGASGVLELNVDGGGWDAVCKMQCQFACTSVANLKGSTCQVMTGSATTRRLRFAGSLVTIGVNSTTLRTATTRLRPTTSAALRVRWSRDALPPASRTLTTATTRRPLVSAALLALVALRAPATVGATTSASSASRTVGAVVAGRRQTSELPAPLAPAPAVPAPARATPSASSANSSVVADAAHTPTSRLLVRATPATRVRVRVTVISPDRAASWTAAAADTGRRQISEAPARQARSWPRPPRGWPWAGLSAVYRSALPAATRVAFSNWPLTAMTAIAVTGMRYVTTASATTRRQHSVTSSATSTGLTTPQRTAMTRSRPTISAAARARRASRGALLPNRMTTTASTRRQSASSAAHRASAIARLAAAFARGATRGRSASGVLGDD